MTEELVPKIENCIKMKCAVRKPTKQGIPVVLNYYSSKIKNYKPLCSFFEISISNYSTDNRRIKILKLKVHKIECRQTLRLNAEMLVNMQTLTVLVELA